MQLCGGMDWCGYARSVRRYGALKKHEEAVRTGATIVGKLWKLQSDLAAIIRSECEASLV